MLDHYLWSTDADHYTRIYDEYIDTGRTPPAPHESEAWHPNTTPTRWRFDTARQALHSRAEAIPLDFSECDLAAVGLWDVVLYLGVLYHMPDPVRALRRVAAVTREQAIIETEAMFLHGHPEALWRFFPSGELNHDRSNWWVPNINALMGLIGAAGFKMPRSSPASPPTTSGLETGRTITAPSFAQSSKGVPLRRDRTLRFSFRATRLTAKYGTAVRCRSRPRIWSVNV